MRLTAKLKNAIRIHAKDCYPNECCGLIVGDMYYPCDNIAPNPKDSFEIDPVALVELSGEIQAIVHSHPDGEPLPSEVDKVQMGLHDVPWVICGLGKSVAGVEYCEVLIHKPAPYTVPLLGRSYIHGLQDCYNLVRDYYQRECGIELADYQRDVHWWENPTSANLYVDNFSKEQFVQVSDLKKHDVIICRVGRTYYPNHALIYLDDGVLSSEQTPDVFGTGLILHHPYGASSRREMFGDNWQKRAVMIVRHKDLL